MLIDLKHLQALGAIERTGTISAAARELGYSQPAVSQQISQAERALGTPLLNRSRGGVTLTEAGEVLVRAGTAALSTVARALSDVEAIAGLRSGTVRVATFPSAAAVLLPAALESARARHPGLSFVVLEREPPEAIEMLRAGKCDVALIYDYSSALTEEEPFRLLPQEVSYQIVKESLKVALPPGHSLARERVIDLRDLSEETWIAGCAESQAHVIELCQAMGFTPRIHFETQNHVAIHRLIHAGFGVALLPELVAAAGRTGESLKLIECSPSSSRTARAVTTQTLMAIPGVRVILDELRNAVGRLL